MIINGQSTKVLRDDNGRSLLRDWNLGPDHVYTAQQPGCYQYLFTACDDGDAVDIAIESLWARRSIAELQAHYGLTAAQTNAAWDAGEFSMTGQGHCYHSDELQYLHVAPIHA